MKIKALKTCRWAQENPASTQLQFIKGKEYDVPESLGSLMLNNGDAERYQEVEERTVQGVPDAKPKMEQTEHKNKMIDTNKTEEIKNKSNKNKKNPKLGRPKKNN